MLNLYHLILYAHKITSTVTGKVSTDKSRIIDRYTWIKHDQDGDDKFLTLKSDGTVVLSPLGKYKITDSLQPSASIRQIVEKYIISLENKPICNNGYGLPVSACEKSKKKKHAWEFIQTRYGWLIENEGQCLTKSTQLFEDNDPLMEWGLLMLPCDESVEQLFTISITDQTNWEQA